MLFLEKKKKNERKIFIRNIFKFNIDIFKSITSLKYKF